jgi:O-antigen/teichoic acid export membrane protein
MRFSRLINTLFEKLLGKALQSADAEKITQGIKKTVIVQAVSYLLVFASNILMVRVAGLENYGMYITVINWMSLLAVVACQGMEDVVLAEIPPSITKGNFLYAKKVNLFANRIMFAGSLAVILAFVVIIKTRWIPLFSNNGPIFYSGLITVYFSAFIVVNQQTLQAFNRFYASQLADKIIKPLLFTFLFGILYLAGVEYSAIILINLTTIVQFFCVLFVLYFLKDTFKHKPNKTDSLISEKPLRYSYTNFYFFIISLLYLLKAKIVIFIFGFAGNAADTGTFNILARLSDFVVVPFFIVHAVVPQLFARHKDADKKYKKELFNRITVICSAGAVLVFLSIVIFGKTLLGFYQNGFTEYYSLLLILSASQMMYSLFGPTIALLMMQGGQKQAALVLLIDVIVSIILFIFFIKSYGVKGAVWATVISVFIYNMLLRTIARKIIN